MSQSALEKINQPFGAVAAVYNRPLEKDFDAHRTPLTKQLLQKILYPRQKNLRAL